MGIRFYFIQPIVSRVEIAITLGRRNREKLQSAAYLILNVYTTLRLGGVLTYQNKLWAF